MQKRTGFLRRAAKKGLKATEKIYSPKSLKKSPKTKPEIPFSKNRYLNVNKNLELTIENKKKAIKFLKNQREKKKKKAEEKQKLLEKRKQYNNQVRKINKEKFKRRRRRNSSIEERELQHVKTEGQVRSKSEEVQVKSHKVSRKYVRNRYRQVNRSEIKENDGWLNQNTRLKILSIEDDTRKNTIDQKFIQFSENNAGLPPKVEKKLQINVDLAGKINQREIINLNMNNSAQKNSTEEDDTKYIKTPEINLEEKYSHNISDTKLSAKSTEKENKKVKRCFSSQKKKSLKVAKQILECKKDLIKLQKKNEMRKKKKWEDNQNDREIERRRNNLKSLNIMLKKRNQLFKKKKRNQDKIQKKDIEHLDKSQGISFNKKIKRKKINVKNLKRNQTFSNLSHKSPCETLNTSKNGLSSHRKKNFGVSAGKRLTYKKMNESLKTNSSSSKLRSANKLGTNSGNNSQFLNPSRGYSNAYKKKIGKSESKKWHTEVVTQFNDISEIQEFNVTDEESLINSSILKNIEEHESNYHNGDTYKQSIKKPKSSTKKTVIRQK